MQGAQEATFQAEADLASTTVRQAWSRPPIQVDFSGEGHMGRPYQASWLNVETGQRI
jgi:hypothetical protein